jgi:hypothetical protein
MFVSTENSLVISLSLVTNKKIIHLFYSYFHKCICIFFYIPRSPAHSNLKTLEKMQSLTPDGTTKENKSLASSAESVR